MIVRRLLLLNGLATIGAVVHHSIAWTLTAMFWWTDRYRAVSVPNYDQIGSATYYAMRVIEQLTAFAVPAFLFVSGVFVAFAVGKSRKTLDWSVVFKRIKGLWIPYLLWSLLILGLGALQGQDHTLLEIVKTLATGGAASPYFYVPLITWLFLLSPLIVPFARSRWKLVLAIAAFIQVPGNALLYTYYLSNQGVTGGNRIIVQTMDWHLPQYAFWFVLGCAVWFHQQGFKRMLTRFRRLLLIALILVFVAGILEGEALRVVSGKVWIAPQVTLTGKIYALLFILTFLAYDNLAPSALWLERIGGFSYGIYLSHVLVLEVVARGIYHVSPNLLGYPLLFLTALALAGLGIPLLSMMALNASPARSSFKYIFG